MTAPANARFARAVFVCLLLATLAPSVGAQEEQYREQEVLNPESDEWVEQPPEAERPPVNALDEARRLLAKDQAGDALKILKKWTKENPAHERYFEGMYLLGEAQFERKRYYQAYEAYETVADNTAGDLFYKTLRREMDVARAFLSGQKRIVWGFMRLPAYDDGIEILDRVWERVPGTRLGELALKLKADYFFSAGDMDLAEDEYVHLTREYPHGRYVQVAMLRSAEAAAAAFPGIKFEDRSLLDAQVLYRRFQSEFPALAEREHVGERLDGIRQELAEKDLYVAKWYQRTGHAGAAEFYYRLVLKDWPETLAAGEAESRLQAMGMTPNTEESQP